MSYETVIVGNGEFPSCEKALEALRKANCIICCDGAVDKLTANGFQPDVVVGDCDSMKETDILRWQSILFIDKSQEYNDLQKALKYCLKNDIKEATLVGCDGLRDDHFIANISIMASYASQIRLNMLTQHGCFQVIEETTTFASTPGQQISVFSPDNTLPLTFHNLKYPVKERCFQHLWEGSLNEAIKENFTIQLHKSGIVVVYFAFSTGHLVSDLGC